MNKKTENGLLPISRRVLLKTASVLTGVLFLGLPSRAQSAGAGSVKHVSVPEFKRLMEQTKGAVIVDVRTPQEFQQGHIKGAILVPLQQLGQLVSGSMPDKDKPYLVYCRSANRSAIAARQLAQMGYTDVTNMLGGIVDWSRQGLPVVR